MDIESTIEYSGCYWCGNDVVKYPPFCSKCYRLFLKQVRAEYDRILQEPIQTVIVIDDAAETKSLRSLRNRRYRTNLEERALSEYRQHPLTMEE